MRLELRHRTRYRYSTGVHLDRHVLRVVPRPDPRQRLVHQRLAIEPVPAGRRDFLDAWGNAASAVWFEGPTERLEIDVRLEVETGRGDPADPDGGAKELTHPLDYGSETAALRPYLAPLEGAELMAQFTSDLVEPGEGHLSTLLERLNRRVHGFYRPGVRLEGAAQSPARTLSRGEGVCRDLAVLFLAACRYLGVAARFASGYQEKPASGSRERRYLHAWAEVYLPQAGWQGWDPTHPTRVEAGHVLVAAAADPSDTAPVEGSFRFTGEPPVGSLEADVRITRRDRPLGERGC